MAAMPMSKPPMPPDVQAQMGGGGGAGAPPFAGVAGQMADQQAQKPPVVQAADAVEKVLTNMAKTTPEMGPYVERMLAIMKAGIEAVANKGGKGGPGGPGGPVPQAPPAGQMPG